MTKINDLKKTAVSQRQLANHPTLSRLIMIVHSELFSLVRKAMVDIYRLFASLYYIGITVDFQIYVW